MSLWRFIGTFYAQARIRKIAANAACVLRGEHFILFGGEIMNAAKKYGRSYFMPPQVTYDWVKKDTLTAPPIW